MHQSLNNNSYILSLSAGHDATASIFKDGHPLSCVHGERVNRFRHQYGIDKKTILTACQAAEISIDQIDFVVFTYTQQMPAVIWDKSFFNIINEEKKSQSSWLKKIFSYSKSNHITTDNPYFKNNSRTNPIVNRIYGSDKSPSKFPSSLFSQRKKSISPEWVSANDWAFYEILSPRFHAQDWLDKLDSNALAQKVAQKIEQHSIKNIESKLYYESLFHVAGKTVPGIILDHHMAHQCSSFFSSEMKDSLILSYDGGTGIESGFISLGHKGKVYPLLPHHLEIGQFYDYVADRLGLGKMGGAGKLMGLASYGSKETLSDIFPEDPGNRYNWEEFLSESKTTPNKQTNIYENLFEQLVEALKLKNIDTTAIGNPERILEKACVDIAATVQNFIEESCLKLLEKISKSCSIDLGKYNLCISGGVGLNCPTNSAIHNAQLFNHVHIEPHCEDGGLVLGGGYFVSSYIKDISRPGKYYLSSEDAYIGANDCFDFSPQQVSSEILEKVKISKLSNVIQDIAGVISKDKVIAICRGRSETGPRALGARSIVANPKFKENWERVNVIKGREKWRPFAPVLLEKNLLKFFHKGPKLSPFMLFTFKIKDEHIKQCPAVVHVDKTSRVQTVKDNEFFGKILIESEKFNIPVLMNTSFNGPGEPIVETAHEAINFFINSGLDYLYINDFKVEKI